MDFDPRHILGPDGPIARRLGPRYEQRDEQIRMVDAVRSALSDRDRLIVEAGTGVGKSFAYLLPAIERIVTTGTDGPGARRDRVVVSTHTIALQEQIVQKDVPLLQAIVDDEFSAVLVKGRGNYLSLRRLMNASKRQQSLFPDPVSTQSLHKIEDWAYDTTDGSLATLPQLERPSVWDKVQSDAGNCMGRRCKTYQKCFYQQARRRMENADLLIVNHALFFSDLALRAQGFGILPPYDHVILDEAHTVEDVASEHFGMSCSEGQVRFLLSGLLSERGAKGFLPSLDGRTQTDHTLDRALACVDKARTASAKFFDDLQRFHDQHLKSSGRIREPGAIENTLSPALDELALALKLVRDDTVDEGDQFELAGYTGRCEGAAATLKALVDQTEVDHVYWLEGGNPSPGEQYRRLRLSCSPIDVGPLLAERLFGATNETDEPISVVLTSATLATGARSAVESDDDATPRRSDSRANNPFEHIQRRLGCADAVTMLLGSPYNYREQARLIIERSMPDPNARDFLERLVPVVLEHVDESDGGAFVLFTSYSLLRAASMRLRDELSRRGMPMLVQGDGAQRSQLLEVFRGDRRSVLLGTDSFWQGVDVQGDALRSVIITKLPFVSPGRPLIEARLERITARGGSAFGEYSLPEAILKFKQGFGRLIRSQQDRGSVVVLDSRIATKGYGRNFIRALPDLDVQYVQRDRHGIVAMPEDGY